MMFQTWLAWGLYKCRCPPFTCSFVFVCPSCVPMSCVVPCKKEPISLTDLTAKIKRVYLASAAEFRDQEKEHESQTGEGTVSAADWCDDDSRSEVSVMFVCCACLLYARGGESFGVGSNY